MSHQNILKYLSNTSKEIEKIVNEQLEVKIEQAKDINDIPAQMVNHFKLLSSKGKHIRGSLVKLGYLISEKNELENILKAAASLEVFQTGILVHDDIMDKSLFRRGVITTHEVFNNSNDKDYGNNMAINLGDFSYYLSFEMMLNSGFSNDLLIKALKIYSEYSQRLVHGQVLDISTETNNQINHDYILKIYKYKTAEYTGVLPLIIGYTLSGKNDKKQLDALITYGTCFGWAFQIQDDILDIFGKSSDTKKPIGTDILEGKNTLLKYYLTQLGTAKQIDYVNSLKGKVNLTNSEIDKVREIFITSGALEKVKSIGIEYVNMGKDQIQIITQNENYFTLFDELIDYMLYRMS